MHTKARGRLRRGMVSLVLAVFIVVGANLATAAPVQAASGQCVWPRCTVYLNKEETQNWAYNGSFPNAIWMGSASYQLLWTGPYAVLAYALWYGNRLFVIQYANRGWCTKVQLSAAPWESQGLMGYPC